jgi:pimeloyl-ACP methyl ester carboxylesterase
MPSILRSASVAMMLFVVGARPAMADSYGEHLEGFAYPHPQQRHTFTSQAQQLTMAYMDVAAEGKANGRTAVLLHGKNFCGATWERTIAELSRAGYRVVVPDQIGFCASSKPRGYQFSFQQLAANTRAMLDHLNVEKAIVIGHSMGGMLAARLALSDPQRVERLVLINPIGLEDWQALGVPYATIDALYETELKTTADSIKAYQLKFYYNGRWRPEYDRWVEMQAGLYSGPAGDIVARNQAQTSEMLFTQPVVHEFQRLQVPTTLLIGGKDRTAPGANRAAPDLAAKLGNYPVLAKEAAAAIPKADLVLWPDLGHSPQIEAPDVFHTELLQRLAR